MPQSSIILFYLIAGFIVYVVSKGELPTYLGFLTGTPSGGSSGGITGNNILSSLIGGTNNSGGLDSGSWSTPFGDVGNTNETPGQGIDTMVIHPGGG